MAVFFYHIAVLNLVHAAFNLLGIIAGCNSQVVNNHYFLQGRFG